METIIILLCAMSLLVVKIAVQDNTIRKLKQNNGKTN
jgi:uncharacterized membrane protein YqhA